MVCDFLTSGERLTLGMYSYQIEQEHLKRYEFSLEYIKKDMNVLDIASGTGYGAAMLAEKAFHVTGIDLSEEAVDYCKKNYNYPNLTFMQGDAENIPFPDSVFDVVISFETIEHLKNPEKFINEVSRVLKRRGIFILSTPNSLVTSPDGVISNPFHFTEFTALSLTRALRNQFALVELSGQTDVDLTRIFFSRFISEIKHHLHIKKQILKTTDKQSKTQESRNPKTYKVSY